MLGTNLKKQFNFYDWNRTISRMEGAGCKAALVIGQNSIGKTFGLRLKAIERALHKKENFVEICRFQNETQEVGKNYFDKLQAKGFFTQFEFEFENSTFYLKINEKERRVIGYIVSLTAFQSYKKRTYANVGYTIFDESILDATDRFHRYLNNEPLVLQKVCMTLWRPEPNIENTGRLFLLGNSVGLINPYFDMLNISIPNYGYTWCNSKTWLLDYVEPREGIKDNNIVFSIFGDNEKSMFSNEFNEVTNDWIADKPSTAKFSFGVSYRHNVFGVWYNIADGIYYICDKVPKNTERPIWSLTREDDALNYEIAKRSNNTMQYIVECYYNRSLRYSSVNIREKFIDMLRLYGVR